jgi:hypothetical protein
MLRNYSRRRVCRSHRHRVSPKLASVWLEMVAAERRELFASPERCAEIEARQPEAESRGRAILYLPNGHAKSGAQKKRRKDASRYGDIHIADMVGDEVVIEAAAA